MEPTLINHEKFMSIVDTLISYGFKINFRPNWDIKKADTYHLPAKFLYILYNYVTINLDTGEVIDDKSCFNTIYLVYRTKQQVKKFELLIEKRNDVRNVISKLRRRLSKQK